MEEVNREGTSVEDIAARIAARTPDTAFNTDRRAEPAEEAVEESVEVEAQAETEQGEAVQAEPEKAEPKDEPEDAEEATSFETIYDLAEALEISPEQFLETIKGKVKVNGQENEVTLAEALKGYQLEADYRQKTASVAEERRQLESLKAKYDEDNQRIQQQIADIDVTSTIALNALMAEYDSIDWQSLERDNPTEYLLQQQKYNARLGQINQAKQALTQRAAEIQQQQVSQLLPREEAALKRAIPDWENEEVAKAEKKALTEYLTQAGYEPTRIASLYDHRDVVMARKAMLYDKAMSDQKKTETKTVKTVKKVLKGGARRPVASVKAENIKKAKQRLKRSGRPDDAVALLLQRNS